MPGLPIRLTTTNPGAVPVYEAPNNGGALSVVLDQNNLGAMPVRTVPFGTGGAVPIIYASSGYTPPVQPTAQLLASYDYSDPGTIDSFERATVAGFTGSGETAYQREAAVDELRDEHYRGSTGPLIILEDDPTQCDLVAPGNVMASATDPGFFEAAWDVLPVTASFLRWEWRLDDTGSWTNNGTDNFLGDNTPADAGTHILNVRAVSTGGVAGQTGDSPEFEVEGAASLTPDEVAGLLAWWDARMGVEEANGDPAENGDPVQFWRDQASSFDLSQATSGKRPTLLSSWSNSQPALDFDASAGGFVGQYMDSGASASLKPFTILAVMSPRAAGNLSIYGASNFNGIQLRVDSSGNLQLWKAASLQIAENDTALSFGTKYIVAITYSGTGVYKFWINGVADGTGTNDQTFDAALTASVGSIFGLEPFDGRIAAVAVYDNVVSDSDIAGLTVGYNEVYALF